MMPLYEFQCEKCGSIEELLVSFSEANSGDLVCENCGGKIKRIFSVCASTGSSAGAEGGSNASPACNVSTG
ncbi:zinc ribbon domain-containing protein [bacterium]|nr:zinc ribbon domain-containing protein [bacterium]